MKILVVILCVIITGMSFALYGKSQTNLIPSTNTESHTTLIVPIGVKNPCQYETNNTTVIIGDNSEGLMGTCHTFYAGNSK